MKKGRKTNQIICHELKNDKVNEQSDDKLNKLSSSILLTL
jgi:hypothetical protein